MARRVRGDPRHHRGLGRLGCDLAVGAILLQAFTVFPDGPAAIIVMIAVYALIRAGWLTSPARLALVGAALAVLPWLHSRYALIAGSAGIVIGLRLFLAPAGLKLRLHMAFLVIPLISDDA